MTQHLLQVAGGPHYPFYPGGDFNTTLWAYISKNRDTAYIDSSEIERFIHNVDSLYNHPYNYGLGAIRVGHQGWIDSLSHRPYIRYACDRIQHYFGDDVNSVVIKNVFQWERSSLTGFLNYMGNSLDVFQNEQYPFHVATNWPNPGDSSAFEGNVLYQTNLIDNRIIASCETMRQVLENSGNDHTRWEMIIQTQREYFNGHFYRRPIEAEIWLQAFLALSRGATGITSFVYRTDTTSYIQWGIVDADTPRSAINPTYNQLAGLYDHLSVLGPKLLNLDVNEAFTWDNTQHQYIQDITGDTADGSHETIEVCIFESLGKSNGENDHFMLINRRCNRNSAGVWVNAFPQHITLTIDPGTPGSYKIRDLYSDEIFVTNDNTFEDIELLAGRGRVFGLSQVYPSDISGTVGYYNESRPVDDAILQLVHYNGKAYDTTDTNGNYIFEDITGGEVNLNPSKDNDIQDAITGSDALLLLQYLAFLATLTEDQQFAADVTEDGNVTGSDALALLRYLAFYTTGIGSTGQWRFDPADSSFILTENTIIDFKAFLLGDVNGDWAQPSSKSDSLGTIAGVVLDFDTPITKEDGLTEVPVTVTNFKEPLYTFLLSISYDPKYLTYQDTKKMDLNEKFELVANGTDSAVVHIAMAGTKGVEKDGEILRLIFKGNRSNISEKNMALEITRAIINDYDIINDNNGQIGLPKQQAEVEIIPFPEHFTLHPNYPNPFNPTTTISYVLPTGKDNYYVTLKIYDALGRLVTTLVKQYQASGSYPVIWDGRDMNGSSVASGIYFYTIQAGDFRMTKKMVLMR